jgi:membrane protein
LILAIGFILMVSLAISTALGLLFPNTGIVWQAVTALVSLTVFVALFALMFKYLPDVRMGWRNVWFGAVLTAVLFVGGKFLIGLYLGHSSVGSSYGAAGALLVLLLWVYYAALIVFLGAEITQVHASSMGSPIEPNDHAEWEPTAFESRAAAPDSRPAAHPKAYHGHLQGLRE